jgi:polyribonucleotide nucleotidyltransferase
MFIRENVKIGDRIVTLETGRIAKQASSVLVTCGETIVLVTAVGADSPRPGIDFFPLSVDYIEKTYAAGKIPGGFFKREGRLRDDEVLVSRLIDRPCRPLFPEGFRNDVQVIATVLSFDKETPADVLAMVGASAALHISNIPWAGPIGGVRVARVDGKLVANPTFAEIEKADLDLVVAASKDAIVMVEGECNEVSEQDLVDALFFAKDAVQNVIDLIERMREAVGKPKMEFTPPSTPENVVARVRELALERVRAACNVPAKHERYGAFKAIKKEVVAQVVAELGPDAEAHAKAAYEDLRYTTMRRQVVEDRRRVDGRDLTTVRPITIETGLLPRVHGSALFTRGETQGIVTVTLGTGQDEQRIDALTGDTFKRFLLHYNFPPYSVGETKPMRGPGRREVGHGRLAERALSKVLPSKEAFPYTIRVVSEITESNGSSSMATVCGGSLALMDAGVPVKAAVAGVAMGLIMEGDAWAVLTDILGDEDHLGDMDFKVCGTAKGITAIQMDIKVSGLSRDILTQALAQAKEGRLHILGKMNEAISQPRPELSKYAPRITTIKIKPDQIRLVIGPGGKMIKAIVDQTGVSIDVSDDGTIAIASSDSAAAARAVEIIRGITQEPEIGQTYKGTVRRVEPYGAFLELMPGSDGLLHISDISWHRVESVEDHMKLGDVVEVKITNIDRDGRIRLSRKELIPKPEGYVEPPPREARGDRGERGDRGTRRSEDRGGRDRDRGSRRDDRPRKDREDRPRGTGGGGGGAS